VQTATVDTPRLSPVTDPTPEVLELYARGGLTAPDGAPLNIFATLANHPALLKRWMVFAAHVLSKSSLSPRVRELAILRTGWNCASVYEFSQHAQIALSCDITADEVQRTKLPVDDRWGELDAAILRAADDLHHENRISDRTWTALSGHLTPEQLIDLVFAIGQYHTVAYALNSFGVELDEGVPNAL
jgi:4-carboxymuconolactone decarboxylase